MKMIGGRAPLWVLGAFLAAIGLGAGSYALNRFFPLGLRVVSVVEGLDTPWAMAFLPDGRMLVTERPGRMRIVTADGQLGPVLSGLPPVYESGEGGLMDVVLDPQFVDSRRLYWTYSEHGAEGRKPTTVVATATLEGDELKDVQIIFRQDPVGGADTHFGSRLLIAPDGALFVGLGDRDRRDDAQLKSSTVGKLIRINRDGSIPADNPFISVPDANPAVWSYGHRNIQGLAFHPVTGELWATEHGPNGGDEINIIRPGANYGWPTITYGCEYGTCAKIGEGVAKAGMEQPIAWFAPTSIPLTELAFIDSRRYPSLDGQLLIGTLWGQSLMRVRLDGNTVIERAAVQFPKLGRVRDVVMGPDGWLYLVANSPNGRIVRLEPLI